MTENSARLSARRARIAAVCAAILILFILGSVFAVTLLDGDEILPKEEIAGIIESYEGQQSSVTAYLLDFGFSGFDKTRLRDVEFCYENYYYKEELPPDLSVAKEAALLFLEHFYDTVSLDDKDEVTAALINCYIYAVGDTYGIYRLPEEYEDYGNNMSGSFVGIGVSVQQNLSTGEMLVTDVFEDSGAEEAGILIGDYIIAVDGRSISEIGISNAAAAIRGEAGTTVTITVQRGAESIDFTVTRRQVVEKVVRYSINEEKIAYIKISSFKENTDEQLSEALSQMEADGAVGVIFDLRDNPGGYLDSVLNAIELLAPSGVRMASYKQRGYSEQVFASQNEDMLDIPCVALVNENTASAGELFAAAIRDLRNMEILCAKIVGRTTYGKGVMQTSRAFSDGAALTLTIAYYNPPSNVNYNGIGISPDDSFTAPDDIAAELDLAYTAISELVAN